MNNKISFDICSLSNNNLFADSDTLHIMYLTPYHTPNAEEEEKRTCLSKAVNRWFQSANKYPEINIHVLKLFYEWVTLGALTKTERFIKDLKCCNQERKRES